MNDLINYISVFQCSLSIASLLLITLLYHVTMIKVNKNITYYYRYFRLLHIAFVASLLGIIDQFLNFDILKNLISLRYIIHIVYIIGLLSLTALFTLYLLNLIGVDDSFDKKWKITVFLPVLLFTIFDVTTFMHRGFFFYYSNGTLGKGALHNLIYLFIFNYIILWIYIVIRYHRILTKNRSIFIVTFAFICVGGILTYSRTDFLGIFNLVYSIALIIIVNTVQRPDDIFDKSGALRRGLLFYDLSQDFTRKTMFSVLFVQIADYQILIDSYGELETNLFMQEIALYLSQVHKNGTLYRMDRSIFALQIPDDDEQRTLFNSREILRRFSEEFNSGNNRVKIPIGISILRCPNDLDNIEDFKKIATNISTSKFEPETIVSVKELITNDRETEVLIAVKKAIANKNFRVFYQPIYSTDKKKIIAAEALIRLFDDKLGFVSPEEFIPLAEKEGYILKIGKFVFTEVCRFLKENNLSQKGIEYIEVNLSAIQCTHYKLAEEFINIMNEYGINSNQINFEITESSVLNNNATVISNISNFTNHGCELSLDDYGTGYSSITYLSMMPFSIIKVDKSILWAADNNEKAELTLENIFEMTRELDLRVVVEGVETKEQIKKLLKYGCDYFQGYYFSKPVKEGEFLDYIENFTVPEVCN